MTPQYIVASRYISTEKYTCVVQLVLGPSESFGRTFLAVQHGLVLPLPIEAVEHSVAFLSLASLRRGSRNKYIFSLQSMCTLAASSLVQQAYLRECNIARAFVSPLQKRYAPAVYGTAINDIN